MESTFERVKEVISEQLGIEDVDTITMETTFIDDLGADSLDIVELIMALEEEFDMNATHMLLVSADLSSKDVKHMSEEMKKCRASVG